MRLSVEGGLYFLMMGAVVGMPAEEAVGGPLGQDGIGSGMGKQVRPRWRKSRDWRGTARYAPLLQKLKRVDRAQLY